MVRLGIERVTRPIVGGSDVSVVLCTSAVQCIHKWICKYAETLDQWSRESCNAAGGYYFPPSAATPLLFVTHLAAVLSQTEGNTPPLHSLDY